MCENNFKLNEDNKGQTVELKGWVNKSRRLGELIFFDLRNETNIVQVIVSTNSKSYEIAKTLRNEFVVFVSGKVIERKNKNKDIASGGIEIDAEEIKIINSSIQTPLLIKDETDALENKRLEYRYLDLRRNINQKNLKERHRLNKLIRNFFDKHSFVEIETPVITKPTVGGANELKVLSANHKNKYYSLAQSPQIYKQLLMYGGISKYYQIAKCFRDEDSRSDRQIEFTQLDMEISFAKSENIMKLIDDLMIKIIKDFKGLKIFEVPKMDYKDAIEKYGSDKPDIRFENLIVDLTKELKKTPVNFISEGIKNNKKVKSLFFEGDISNSEIKKIEEKIKSQGSSGLAWLKFNDGLMSGSLKSLDEKNIFDIKNKFNIKNKNGILFVIIDNEKESFEYIGRVRLLVAEKMNLINDKEMKILWVKNFPLFENNSNNEIESAHNPFTSVLEEDLKLFRKSNRKSKKEELLSIRSNSYDLVLNGTEIGGGAIRISNMKDQLKIFELMGLTEEQIEFNFGWFLEAQKYGIPTHGGIALGIDRILSILLNTNSIRDVIAFPKSTSGVDDMMKAPIKIK